MSDARWKTMNIGKKGYCIRPGCPVEHVLTLDCWVFVRRFLHESGNYDEYVALAKRKS